MTKQRIEITDYNWDHIVHSPLEFSGIPIEFLYDLKNHLSQYQNTGYHYIGFYYDDMLELENYLISKIKTLIPTINMYISFGLKSLGENNTIPRGTETTKHFESNGDGVGEISPINAVVGDITSPDSKTHSETVSDYTDIHKTTDDYIKAFRFSEKYKSLVTVIGELIANTIIAEFNTLY